MNPKLLTLTLILASCSPSLLHEPWTAASSMQDPGTDTAGQRGFRDALLHLTSPELELRKKNRRAYQQRHYAEILYELAMADAPGAILASLRSRMQLELQLPSNTLVMTVPVTRPRPSAKRLPGFTGDAPGPPMQFPLYEDRRFPDDPWSRP